jgi:uncharacterized protein with HEPN domain
MSNRDITLYIVDIFIAIDKIERYTETFTDGSALLSSELHWDASIRELEVIGEATKYLLEDDLIEKKYRRIVDFRNQIIHGYFGIDETIVWEVIVDKLPEYKNDLKNIVHLVPLDLSFAIEHAKEESVEREEVIVLLDELKKNI